MSKIKLEAVLDTLLDGAVITNASGIIQKVNSSIPKIFGYRADELLNQNVKILIPPPFEEEHDRYLQNYQRTKRQKIIGIGREVEGRKKDGTIFPMDLAVGETLIGDAPVFVGIIRDLSHQHAERQQINFLQEEYFHLSRIAAMNEMGSAVAHDLNQPMAAMLNYLETARLLLSRDGSVDKSKLTEILDKSIDQTQRASLIINRLRNQFSKQDLPTGEIGIATVLQRSIRIALKPFVDRNISIKEKVAKDLPNVSGNESQIQMVLIQIIRNACEAIKNTETPEIEISIKNNSQKKELSFAIADNGKGLTKDDIQSLFVPLGSSNNGKLGVGLSICHSIISRHGGQIWAESNHPDGAVFHFTLPVL